MCRNERTNEQTSAVHRPARCIANERVRARDLSTGRRGLFGRSDRTRSIVTEDFRAWAELQCGGVLRSKYIQYILNKRATRCHVCLRERAPSSHIIAVADDHVAFDIYLEQRRVLCAFEHTQNLWSQVRASRQREERSSVFPLSLDRVSTVFKSRAVFLRKTMFEMLREKTLW